MDQIECPRCNHEFEVEQYSSGSCPKCDNKFWSDEWCDDDYIDCDTFYGWEFYG